MNPRIVPWKTTLLIGSFFVLGSVWVTVWGCGPNISDRDIEYVSAAEVQRLASRTGSGDASGMLLIDARSPQDFRTGHIPGSENITLDRLDLDRGRDPRLESFSRIVVYGENPGSTTARAVTKRLLALGYDDVQMFAGGLAEWRKADLPVQAAE